MRSVSNDLGDLGGLGEVVEGRTCGRIERTPSWVLFVECRNAQEEVGDSCLYMQVIKEPRTDVMHDVTA
jgi:hypothetical protein